MCSIMLLMPHTCSPLILYDMIKVLYDYALTVLHCAHICFYAEHFYYAANYANIFHQGPSVQLFLEGEHCKRLPHMQFSVDLSDSHLP